MKRLFYLFIFLICYSSAFAQNKIKLETTLGAKIYTLNNFKIKTDTDALKCKVGYLNLNFKESLAWKGLSLSIKADNFFNADNPITYSPQQIIYSIEAEYAYKNFKVEFNHSCYHPVKYDGNMNGELYGGYEYFGILYKF